jgi:peptide subunit release factor RF-3
MAVERERGIPVPSAVMSFERDGSPATCSTRVVTRISARILTHLTAVDSAVIVLEVVDGKRLADRRARPVASSPFRKMDQRQRESNIPSAERRGKLA